MRFFRKCKSIVAAVHDGMMWRAYAFRSIHGEWTCVDRADEESRNNRHLSKELLDFIGRSGMRRLRILLSGDVHMLTTALPEDATDEELHTALAYETQGEIGLEAADHRLPAVRAELFGMGADRKALLASSFEIARLERFAEDAESEGVSFECAGSLELAILAVHAQRSPNRRMLMVRERSSFYAIPADQQPFTTSVLPLGGNTDADITTPERIERVRERLTMHNSIPLSVIVSGDVKVIRTRIMPFLGNCRDVEFVSLQELEESALKKYIASRVGGVDSVCPWIGLPPPPRDPHRHGTVLFFIILLAALAWVGWRKHALETDLRSARANHEAWETLENSRRQLESEVKALRNRQHTLLKKKALLEQPTCLPHGLLPLLDTLARNMPNYSYLQSITQRDDDSFDIVGLTRWQDGLTQLDAALRIMAQREGLRREFGGLETIEGQYAQRFRFTVTPEEAQP